MEYPIRFWGIFPWTKFRAIASSEANFENCAISLPNLVARIWLKDMPDIIAPLPPAPAEPVIASDSPVDNLSSLPTSDEISEDAGEFQCPICWLHFEGKNIKHISSHEELIGDPILGLITIEDLFPKMGSKWCCSR